jgi:hypothetical protein
MKFSTSFISRISHNSTRSTIFSITHFYGMFQVVKLGGSLEKILNNIGYKFQTFTHYKYGVMFVES